MIAPHPHEARIQARLATYPNQHEEKLAVAAIEQAVFQQVRTHEQHLAENARRFLSSNAVHLKAADELETRLRQRVRYLLEDGATAATVAREYELVRLDAQRAVEALGRASKLATFHATVVRDPYKSFCDLMEKYPGLRSTSLGG